MITPTFIIFLSVGTLAMLIPLLVCGRVYKIKVYKCIIAAFCLTLVGTAGTYVMAFIENGFQFGGRSFYGAVFLIPVVFIAVAPLLRVRYGELIDMSAPSVAIMLVLMKSLCIVEDCCIGRIIYVTENGTDVYFPSQVVEVINAAVIFTVLLYMICKKRAYGKIYPWFMVIYGATRFVLNFFRYYRTPFVWILPAGHFWSLISLAAGVLWLVCLAKKESKEIVTE